MGQVFDEIAEKPADLRARVVELLDITPAQVLAHLEDIRGL